MGVGEGEGKGRGRRGVRGGEEGVDVGVEGGHAGDGGRVRDESRAEDADGGGGHGDFDGVVDV